MSETVIIPAVMGLFFTGYLPHLAWCWWLDRRDVRHRAIIERWLLELPDGTWVKE